MKRRALLGTLLATFVCSLALGLCSLPALSATTELVAAEETAETVVTHDEAVVYDLWELTNEKSFTSGAEKNRNIGQLPDTHNVAVKAKFSYDSTNTEKILIINFLMGHKNTVNSQYFLQDCGYMFFFRDNTARLVYQGDGTETNQLANTAVSLGWADLSAKLATIDNLDGNGKINAEGWRYGREPFLFEMGYVKAYTDGEWTGNYVYVKINDVELMSFTDTGAHYQDKGTYFGKGATGYAYTYYTFSSVASFDDVQVYDLYDLKGVKEHSPTKKNDSTQNIGKFNNNNNVAFRAKVTHADSNDHAFALNYLILKSDSGSHFANGGYGYQFYMRDNYMKIRYDATPTTTADKIADGVSLSSAELDKLLPTIADLDGGTINAANFKKGKVPFIFEFGCKKYYMSNVWVGNYVYAKINDVEVMHFIDRGANFKNSEDLGYYTGCGADLREYCQRTFSTTYTAADMIEDQFTMSNGASVYGAGGGLKFDMTISESAYAKLSDFVGADTLTYGMLIIPEDYVASKPLTVENLFGESATYYLMQQDENGAWKTYTGDKTPVFNVTGNELDNYAFNGSIIHLKDYNITRNFVGLGYIKYTDGDTTQYFLANYADGNIANNTRSMYQVAKAAVESGKESETMTNKLQTNYLDKVAEVTVNYHLGADKVETETLVGVIGETFFAPLRSFDGYTFISGNNEEATAIIVATSGNELNYYFNKTE